MNWKKGFVRLWLAVSLLWLIYPTYVLQRDLRPGFVTLNIEGQSVQVDDSFLKLSPDQQNATVDEIAKSLRDRAGPHSAAEDVPLTLREEWRAAERQKQQDAIRQFIIFGLGPPVALLLLGFTVGWVIAGFRQQPTK